ncbi:hypothetical protein N7527_003487 [Penicillium freii]|nr:hypothetical protein N7527_003487 [Penicillium freii]
MAPLTKSQKSERKETSRSPEQATEAQAAGPPPTAEKVEKLWGAARLQQGPPVSASPLLLSPLVVAKPLPGGSTANRKNLITLGSQEHNCWDNYIFAFRPVRTYQQNTKMDIAFHLLPLRESEKRTDYVFESPPRI